jgi:phytoene dehydrogenase-like protein
MPAPRTLGWTIAVAIVAASPSPAPPRVAIIGSGVSGASTAYHLAKAHPGINLTVFERDGQAGGRARTSAWPSASGGFADAPPVLIDEGATSVSSFNRYIVGWMAEFNITAASSPAAQLAVWDECEVAWRADLDSAFFSARMVMRYGLTPLRLRELLRTTVANLTAVYQLQATRVAFDSPAALYDALGLLGAARRGAAFELAALGIDGRFIAELVDGAARCNYLQSSAQLSSLVNLVSLAGASAAGSVFRLKGGTQPLVAAVLRGSGAQLRLGAEVVSIERAAPDQPLTLSWREAGKWLSRTHAEQFDAVVIAAPLEASPLRLSVAGVADVPRARPFVQTHATFVEAAGLSAARFGADAARTVGDVFTTDKADAESRDQKCAAKFVPFVSIGLNALLPLADGSAGWDDLEHARAAGQRGVWKVFSKAALSDSQLDSLFDGRERRRVKRVVWEAPGAYPRLGPSSPAAWPRFALARGLIYAGAAESAVSCLETQAIAGRNAALLVGAELALRSAATA